MNKKINRSQRRRMAKFLKKNFEIQRKSMRKKLQEGKDVDEEPTKPSKQQINKVLKKYIELNSYKKTAISLGLTLTKTKNIIKENRKKLEKMIKKGSI
jgi:hypothetical protein